MEQELLLILRALETAGGNQTQAARILRIGRDSLRYKLKKHNLLENDVTPRRVVSGAPITKFKHSTCRLSALTLLVEVSVTRLLPDTVPAG